MTATTLAPLTSNQTVFTTYLQNDENGDIRYSRLASNEEVINVWTYGDNTGGNGTDMTVREWFHSEYFSHKLSIVTARNEYAVKCGKCAECRKTALIDNELCQECLNDGQENYFEGRSPNNHVTHSGFELNPSSTTATVVTNPPSDTSIFTSSQNVQQEAVLAYTASNISLATNNSEFVEICRECGRTDCDHGELLGLIETEITSSKGNRRYTTKLWVNERGGVVLTSCTCEHAKYRRVGGNECRHIKEARELWLDRPQTEKVAA